MRNVFFIARRELRSYFDSPIAYIVVVAFLLIAGWMFFSPFFLVGRADLRRFFHPEFFSPATLLVIFAPAITMRLIAEEKRSGTIEFLTTLPVTDAQVILGKFAAAFVMVFAALLTTFIYAIFVAFIGDLDLGPFIGGLLGMSLFAASLLAIGLLISALSDSQIVAFIIAASVCTALYFVNWLQFFMPEGIAPIVEYISVSFHLANLARGVIDTRDLLYYFTVTGGCLFLAVLALKKQHA